MVDIESMRKSIDILDKYIDNDRIPRHVTFGNHEQRVFKFEEQIPEIQGMMKKSCMTLLINVTGNILHMVHLKILQGCPLLIVH